MHAMDIAVIGAGLAGISAAKALTDAGHQVVLFDKSRGSGGRMSSKRTEYGDMDMGAQYFTARDHHFRHELKHWLDQGWVAEWQPALFIHDQDGLRPSQDEQQRFVGAPRMTALSRGLLEGLKLVTETRIIQLQQQGDKAWELIDEQQQVHGPFDRIVVAAPAPQAVPLLEPAVHLAQAAAQIDMEPGWALAVSFAEPLDTPVEACFVRSGCLDWISRNSSKPGRTGNADNWVLQATPAWSREHIDTDKEEIIQLMLASFSKVMGFNLPAANFVHAHRWLYARPSADAQWGALAAPEKGIYACGDWCMGGRMENAWLSGRQAAHALLGLR